MTVRCRRSIPANPQDFFLFVTNDNDFIHAERLSIGASYKDDTVPISTPFSWF